MQDENNNNFDYQAFCEQMSKNMPSVKKNAGAKFWKISFAVLIIAGVAFSLFSNFILLQKYNNLLANQSSDNRSAQHAAAFENQDNTTSGEQLTSGGLSTQQVVKKAIPAVVAIKTEIEVQNFWGKDKVTGAGSGVIIDKDGYIVTNYHVIEGAKEITVNLAGDDTAHKAKLVAGDARTDLAVLKITDKKGPFPYIKLADSQKVEIGEKAIAIGNPLGDLEGTVTQGIISGLNREVYTKSAQSGKLTRLNNVIQTDASINAGNSGGALLNNRGELIGINTAKASSRDGVGVEGIGFAIPSNTVKRIISELLKKGYVSGRPVMGIRVTDVSESNAELYGMPVGVYIVAVDKDSAAEAAGLRRHDIITKMNGEPTKNSTTLNAIKDRYKAGDTVELEVWRQGETKKIKLTFSEAKPEKNTSAKEEKQKDADKAEDDNNKEDSTANGAEKKGKNSPNGKSKRKAVKRNDSDSDNEFEGNDREPDAFK